ncbi:MAG: hypothetical protein ACW9XA_05970 [Candidatus Nitrosopumilus sp. bin_6a]
MQDYCIGIAVLLIEDSVFVFKKLSHVHIIGSLLKEDENPEPE